MRLIEGSLGSLPGLAFLHTSTLRATVDLGRPATRVKALLRGFTIGHTDEDHNLKHLAIDLSVGYGDTPSHVEVIANVRLSDQSPQSEWILIGSELIEVRVAYTLLVD